MMWDFKQFKDKIAVIDDSGVEFTYNELDKEGEILFQRIGKRALVFCLCQNTAGMVLGYTSFINHHIVPLMLSADIDRSFLNKLINIYKPSFIWAPNNLKSEFDSLEAIYDSFGYVLLKTTYEIEYELYEELCLLIQTSGSTGSPKLVRLSYNNVSSNAISGKVFYRGVDYNTILNLPMNYVYTLAILNIHLMLGCAVLPTRKSILQKEFWDFVRRNSGNEIYGVPSSYEMLMRLNLDKMDLPKIQLMTQSGGKMSYALSEKLANYAISHDTRLIVLYGQSEATAILGYLSEDMIVEKCGSIGEPLPGSEYNLIDDNGNLITKSGVRGELVFKGPGVALGYAESIEDLSKADEFNGVLYTGDIASFDDDGYYYIVGRKKRFLKLYGKRVSLDEIEELIKVNYPNIDCATSGKDDEMIIFITDNKLIEEINNFISKKTNIYYGAFRVIPIDEIPRNSSGKTLYSELAKFD